MSKNQISEKMILFATPFGITLAAGIPTSKHVWVQAAGIGLSLGLIIGAILLRWVKP